MQILGWASSIGFTIVNNEGIPIIVYKKLKFEILEKFIMHCHKMDMKNEYRGFYSHQYPGMRRYRGSHLWI